MGQSTSAAFTRSEDPAPCPQPALSPPLPSCSRPSSSPTCAKAKAPFSERVDAIRDEEDAGGGQQGQDPGAEPVLPTVEPLVGRQPRAVVFHHAADRAETGAVRRADLPDAGLDTVAQAEA